MPRGDRTGPGGMGPMTGRAAGYCAGYAVPGFANMGPRAGMGFDGGFNRGASRGWRNRYYATGLTGWQRGWYPPAIDPEAGGYQVPPGQAMTKKQQIDMLKEQAEYFEGALGEIKKRLEEMEAKPGRQGKE